MINLRPIINKLSCFIASKFTLKHTTYSLIFGLILFGLHFFLSSQVICFFSILLGCAIFLLLVADVISLKLIEYIYSQQDFVNELLSSILNIGNVTLEAILFLIVYLINLFLAVYIIILSICVFVIIKAVYYRVLEYIAKLLPYSIYYFISGLKKNLMRMGSSGSNKLLQGFPPIRIAYLIIVFSIPVLFVLGYNYNLNTILFEWAGFKVTPAILYLTVALLNVIINTSQSGLLATRYIRFFSNVPVIELLFNDKTKSTLDHKNVLSDIPQGVEKKIRLSAKNDESLYSKLSHAFISGLVVQLFVKLFTEGLKVLLSFTSLIPFLFIISFIANEDYANPMVSFLDIMAKHAHMDAVNSWGDLWRLSGLLFSKWRTIFLELGEIKKPTYVMQLHEYYVDKFEKYQWFRELIDFVSLAKMYQTYIYWSLASMVTIYINSSRILYFIYWLLFGIDV